MTMLTIIIPTYNAAAVVGGTLKSLTSRQQPTEVSRETPAEIPGEISAKIIVADGGSTDETRQIVTAAGATLAMAPKGRGQQLAAGARAAGTGWLLFLHADTRLADHWPDAVTSFAADPANARRAGYFRFALDDAAPAARRLEKAVFWRNRLLGLPYGDQGLLISREFYQALGGYRPIPLMEDVDLAVRIGRHRLVMLDSRAVTSAEKYRREGYLRRSLRNAVCLSLYVVGIPPRVIARLYG